MEGSRLGDYVVLRELGRGGMGKVYLAEHATLGRRVALKVLAGEIVDHDTAWRFLNEARAAVQIGHPGIVEMLHFGVAPGGAAYLVMELLAGESLASRLRRAGALPVPVAVGLARQIAGVLAAAHRAHVVHRDLKPDNVFLVVDPETGRERVKLLDFGIAKLATELAGPIRTRENAVFGTPAYMSPEQWFGAGTVDHRTDLYALGCMLFELLVGTPPFDDRSQVDVAAAHLHRPAPDVRARRPEAPRALGELVARLLAKARDERPASAQAVADTLDAIARALAPRGRWPAALAVVGAVGAAVALGGTLAVRDDGASVAPVSVAAKVVPRAEVDLPSDAAVPADAAAPVDAAPAHAPVRRARDRARETSAAPTTLDAGTAGPALEATGALDALVERAREAYLEDNHVAALHRCQRALDARPGHVPALRVCALAACRLGLGPQARGYLDGLPEPTRTTLARTCPAATPE